MTEQTTPQIDAADAFERVRGELTLLHSAIEGLTAAREKTPDYSVTLGNMAHGLGRIDARLAQIEQSRALALSPVELSKEINAAAEAVRSQDRKMLCESRDALTRSLGWVDTMIARGQAVERRIEREWMIGVGGLVAGALLWSILPGAIMRSLPEDWHAPEWAAARIMGMEQAQAGQRLIKAAEKADEP